MLRRCNLSLDSPWLCGLTTLFLDDLAPTSRQSINQIFSASRNTPNLKVLELHEGFPVAPTRITVNEDSIPLPYLRCLRIDFDVTQAVIFLNLSSITDCLNLTLLQSQSLSC